MFWSIFDIRKALKIPKLFNVFSDDDNGKMFKFITCSIVFLMMMLGGLGCVAIISTASNPVSVATQAAKGAVTK